MYGSKNLYFISDLKNSLVYDKRIYPMETTEKEIWKMSAQTKLYPNFQIMWDSWVIGYRSYELLKLLYIVLDELLQGETVCIDSRWNLFECWKVHQKVLGWWKQHITPFTEALHTLEITMSMKTLYIFINYYFKVLLLLSEGF